MAEETVILNFEVNQTEAQSSLIQTEKAILSLKKQQTELNKEYKEGKVTEDQYVESNIKLQQSIKKESEQKRTLTKLIETESNSRNALRSRISTLTREYNNINTATETGAKRSDELQKELVQLNEQLNKGSKAAGNFKDNIGNYPDAVQGAISSTNIFNTSNNQFSQNLQSLTQNINVAGTSVGGLGSKLLAFASPVTAVAGVLSLLGSAFLSTRDGAELLEAAQFQLQASFQILGRETANMVDGLSKLGADENGEGGALSRLKELLVDTNPIVLAFMGSLKLLDTVTGGAVTNIGNQTEALAKAKDAYDNLLRVQIEHSEKSAELERDIEKAKTEREEENTTIERRIQLDNEILSLEKIRADLLVSDARARFTALKTEADLLGGVNKLTDDQLQLLIDSKNEVANLEGEYATRIRKIKSDIDNLNTSLREQLALNQANARATQRQSTGPGEFQVGGDSSPTGETPEQIVEAQNTKAIIENQEIRVDANRRFNADILAENKKFYKKDLEFKRQAAELKQKVDEAQLASTASILGAAASLFDQQSNEYKIFATAQTLISTYAAATKAYEAAFVPPTVASPALGVAYAAAAIAQGLANVAAINGVQFAEGGWTGPGDKYKPVGIVHADEYVTPKHIVNHPAAQPHLSALENMRVRGYADGGFVTNQNIASTKNALITANALKNQPPVYVSWVEGQKVGRRVEFREKTSKI